MSVSDVNPLHTPCLPQVGTRTLEVSEEEPGAVMELSNPALNVLTKQRPANTPPASLADPASCSGLQVARRAAQSRLLSVDLKTRPLGYQVQSQQTVDFTKARKCAQGHLDTCVCVCVRVHVCVRENINRENERVCV